MSIATYTDLQAALGNWLDHSLFAARYGDFIALFEAAANRRLRVKEMEALATLTPAADGTVALPSDYLAYRRCTWTGQARNELRYVQPAYFQAAFPTRPADVPRFFTIESLHPQGDAARFARRWSWSTSRRSRRSPATRRTGC